MAPMGSARKKTKRMRKFFNLRLFDSDQRQPLRFNVDLKSKDTKTMYRRPFGPVVKPLRRETYEFGYVLLSM